MKRFSSKAKAKFGVIVGAVALGASSAMADTIDVDLTDATTSITNAGTAMVALAVTMLGIALVYGFIRRRG